jgi:hypothetical protein
MRQALFAVVLVSASFAGGAAVNGPGLRWAQAMILGRLGVEDDGENPAAHPSAIGEEPIPARPIAPLSVDPSPAQNQADAGKGKTPKPTPDEPRATEPSEREPARPAVTKTKAKIKTASSSTLPGLAPVPEGTPPPIDPPAPLATTRERDREALALAAATIESVKGEDKDKEKGQEPDDTSSPLARMPALDMPRIDDGSSSQPARMPGDRPIANAPAAVPATTGEWAEVRRSMRELGVSRYGIEGEPGGRVRFHCVIPLAGQRAVGQHFEAEGDDELAAARSALRRVALWRATEANAHTP